MISLQKELLNEFLKFHSLDDIKQEVFGELPEFSTDNASYCYGNGEVIIYPANPCEEDLSFVYVIDTYGGTDYLVEF